MLSALFAVVIGLMVLVWSADKFVLGAAATARRLGMSPLLVGLTIVSIGTSAPELFVSAVAALDGVGNLAIGNAVGSNITNIGLVLGVTALIAPIPLQQKLLRKELPLMLLVTVLASLTLVDLELTLMDAIFLMIGMVVAMYILFQESDDAGEALVDEDEAAAIESLSSQMAMMWLVVGLLALMASSKALVWGATIIAQSYGVSDLVIGLTIVAIGTSLPELAASVASAIKGHHEIAIGNVIGSNIFNLLMVMPIPGLLAGIKVEPLALYRDVPVMIAFTAALLVLFILSRKRGQLGRGSGILLLGSFVGYLLSLFLLANE
ncbi:calcium/sodium antiporter [Parathalassolituus penaei]|uniref:Calcium/sodium antiporter n=1 Tax=Parathalassolituus penaei TaxID=2997323 RepID=A0A9X3ISS5_9GAMM|nr:calcium/sodium antiporter [Parathalassolituus penaei]MCY0965555.1 calcium/sodium antiporter [Parathalassolituus penaei]